MFMKNEQIWHECCLFKFKLLNVRVNQMKTIVILLAFLVGLTIVVSQVEALPINVLNASFENPSLSDDERQDGITGWNTSGNVGVFNPAITAYVSVPEGENIAFFANGGGSISKGFDVYLQPNNTLQVDVGDRLDNLFRGYEIALFSTPDAGSTWSLLFREMDALVPQDEFVPRTVSYSTSVSDPYLGQQLYICIRSTGPSGQTNVDNVRLEANPISRSPEPGTLFLLGAGLVGIGLVVWRRKRQK
jgi:hypothetical protein